MLILFEKMLKNYYFILLQRMPTMFAILHYQTGNRRSAKGVQETTGCLWFQPNRQWYVTSLFFEKYASVACNYRIGKTVLLFLIFLDMCCYVTFHFR